MKTKLALGITLLTLSSKSQTLPTNSFTNQVCVSWSNACTVESLICFQNISTNGDWQNGSYNPLYFCWANNCSPTDGTQIHIQWTWGGSHFETNFTEPDNYGGCYTWYPYRSITNTGYLYNVLVVRTYNTNDHIQHLSFNPSFPDSWVDDSGIWNSPSNTGNGQTGWTETTPNYYAMFDLTNVFQYWGFSTEKLLFRSVNTNGDPPSTVIITNYPIYTNN